MLRFNNVVQIILIGVLGLGAVFSGTETIITIGNGIFSYVELVQLCVCLYFARNGSRKAIVFCCAWLWMNISTSLWALSMISLIPHHPVYGVLGISGAALEALLLSLLLSEQLTFWRSGSQMAERYNKNKSAFLNAMSHQIRTPLNGVLGGASLLGEGVLEPTQRFYQRAIVSSAESLSRIVNDVIDLDDMNNKKLYLKYEPVNLEEFMMNISSIFYFKRESESVCFLLSYSHDLPSSFTTDVGRLRQVIVNLVGNAFKFTLSGSVILKLEKSIDGNCFVFSVRDTGCGIPVDSYTKIFNAFEQANESAPEQYDGTGLGLTISKKMVEMMGGTIGFSSEEGSGSHFYFTLPIHDDDRPLKMPTVLLDQSTPKMRAIIWVNNEVASLLEPLLIQEDYQVICLNSEVDWVEQIDIFSEVNAWVYVSRRNLSILSERYCNLDVILQNAEWVVLDGASVIEFPVWIEESNSWQVEMPGLINHLLPSWLMSSGNRFATSQQISVVNAVPEQCVDDNKIVLIVDDEKNNLVVLQHMLESLGMNVWSYSDGTSLLAAYKANPKKYIGIITDCYMPDMNGFDLARAIRCYQSENDLLDIPLIACTAHIQSDISQRCFQAGMVGFIQKPIDLASVKYIVNTYF